MKSKLWSVMTIVVVVGLALSACAPAATPTPVPKPTAPPPTPRPTTPPEPALKITVATDATWPPFEFVDETTKEIVGFDADLMAAIAEEAGFDFEFVNVAWDPLLAGMATGEYDAAISAMTITEERAKQWDFSEPYYAAGQLIAVRTDETSIKTPEDLDGKVAGAQIGTTGAIYIEEEIPGATLKTYDEISQAFLDLINGQIDAVVADDPLVEAMVGKYSDVIWVGGVLTAEDYGIAVRKGAPEILAAINKGLQAVKDNGVLQQLKDKWIAVEAPEPTGFQVGYVTDTGGIDDKSFNTNQWEGIQRAVTDLGVEAQFIQSDEATQYESNLTEFASQGYDLVFASGFFLGGDLAKVAAQYPEVKFTIVDYAYPDPFGVPEGIVGNSECIPNVMGQVFKTDQAAFLAGYLAAGMTKTGKIGYFGGAKIPTVTIFGVGFQAGMEHYNQVHTTNVQLIGWDNDTGEGLFTGDFQDLTKGKEATESLFDEGADIFIPVGGLIGSPGFDVARERGGYGVWVDVDGYNLLPEARDVLLTSVMKKMDNSCYSVIKETIDGEFQGCGTYIGSLENGGVGIAPYHDLESAVPTSLKAEIADLEARIISGELSDTGCLSYPQHCPGGLYEEEPLAEEFRVGYVTDTGGIDDKSFNTNQWEGIQRAVTDLGVKAQFIQSDEATQYESNLTEFASQGYDLVFASGFFLGGDLAKVAAQYPKVKFTIVDYAYPDPFGVPEGIVGNSECIPNVMGQVFKTDQAAFLAGYLAAGMTKTGKIGYFGGAKIPTVTIFGVGFQAGMEHYNQVHTTNVQLIGWDNDTGEGLFTGDFQDLTKGKEATESLFDEGADIFIPVGGLIGSPGFDVARERGGYGVWVDVDGYYLLPEARDVLLSSVMKKMDNSCYSVIKETIDGEFQGCGTYIGSLENGGVGIAPYHDLESAVPTSLKAEIADLEAKIISGELSDTGCLSYPQHCPGGLY